MFNVLRTFELTTGVKSAALAVFCDGSQNTKVLLHKTIVFERKGRRVILRNTNCNPISALNVINRALYCHGFQGYVYRTKGKLLIDYKQDLGGKMKWKEKIPFRYGMNIFLAKDPNAP